LSATAAFQLAGVILLFLTLSIAAVTDLLNRRVYNWLTYPAIAFGLTLGYAAGDLGSLSLHGAGLVNHLAGFALGFGVFALVWIAGRGVGGGEVKLMGAIGAIMGWQFVIGAMFWSSLVGAVMAVWALVMRGKLVQGLGRAFRAAVTIGSPPEDKTAEEGDGEESPGRLRIPYGTAIAFGTLFAWFLTEFPGGAT
jgi:prepilin peptidase CpaA